MALLSKLFTKESPNSEPVVPVAPEAVVEAPVDYTQLEAVARTTQNMEERIALAIDGPTTHIRQMAAEGINDPEVLKELVSKLRGKDKNVYRIVKDKCDALHEIEKIAAAKQAAAAQLCESIEHHIYKPFDNIYVAALDHYVTQWQPLADGADQETVVRATAAIEKCRDVISTHIKRVANQAALADAVANADVHRAEILAMLTTVLAKVLVAETLEAAESAASEVEHCSQRWQQGLQYKAANRSDQVQHDRLQSAIRKAIAQIAKHGPLQQQLDALLKLDPSAEDSESLQALDRLLIDRGLVGDVIPELVSRSLQAMTQRRQQHADKDAAHTHAQRQTAGLIRKALAALQAGQTAQATGLRRAIEEKLEQSAPLPVGMANQLRQLDTKLDELRDWKSYAVAPKRQQLIEQMETLAAQAQHITDPNELAERIKKLQDEWKLISKGNTDNTDAEWQRFHAAAQIAFQPCREFFAKQAEQRHRNLELRQALLERITQFAISHNWEQPDWRQVAKALREARQLWRGYQPVERAANKPLQEQFDTQLSALQTRLDGEYASNTTEKKRIIARAQRLLTIEGREAVDELKRLQSAWKEIGSVAREEEQKLWEEFRLHCDAVFAKRQQQHAEHNAALQGSKQQAEALCEQVEQLQLLSGSELHDAAKKLPELREAFSNLGELPKAIARNIESRFDKALRAFDKMLSRQRELDKAIAWDKVLVAGDKIRIYRLSITQSAASEQIDALKQETQRFIDETSGLPKAALQAIKQQLAIDPAQVSQDLNANAAKLRELCIRAEILTDTPTPAEDQAARRAYQMQRLTQGFGKNVAADTIESLILEFIGAGATTDSDYTSAFKRLDMCRKSLMK